MAGAQERFDREVTASFRAISAADEITGDMDTAAILREAEARRPRVCLLLEDDEQIAYLVTKILSQAGVETVVARTFLEAEAILADTSNTVAFAILDHGEMAGSAILAADLSKHGIPAVVYTGQELDPDDVHGLPVIHKTERGMLVEWVREQAVSIR